MLDIPFMQHIEMQNMGVRFVRCDAELIDNDETQNHLFDMLCEYVKKQIGDSVEIKAQKISAKLPAILLLDEFSRRMDEAQKYYGMANFGGNLKYTLVLNTDNALIQTINKMEESDKKEASIKYVYDLARLNNGTLSPEDVEKFIENSATLLEKSL